MNNHGKRIAEKARRFCAWRERCTREVEEKLQRLGAGVEETQQIISVLRDEGFLNDTRFAELFVRSRFSGNKWGKVKIRAALQQRNIPDPIVRNTLSAIPEETYTSQLKQLIAAKYNELQKKGKQHSLEKTAAYCIQKGYEPDLVWTLLRKQSPAIGKTDTVD